MKWEKGIGKTVTAIDELSEESAEEAFTNYLSSCLITADSQQQNVMVYTNNISRFLVFNKFSLHDLKKWWRGQYREESTDIRGKWIMKGYFFVYKQL